MPRTRRTFSRYTLDAAAMLGAQVAQARRERRMKLADLAERAGVTPTTVRKVERGDPTVAVGTAFEVARLVGVSLYETDDRWEMASIRRRAQDRLTLLPSRVRSAPSRVPSGDF